ncbi:hypothetical protein ASPBRDRAFT_40228 [Aspergillus brasiliensis CBS 101740]|uniref:Uncharacterized protein n=1 Tax=Aspergillus brasiliensis (strain CBS 101740 / IMI 381727 / IBT 21946) TaxID=767769 RepID=A0A1L9UTT0_ASPBC|nr:hypothetical protein ASPBRDRAFT_40228 [Aspergillus brasiliensis CBS 101740]
MAYKVICSPPSMHPLAMVEQKQRVFGNWRAWVSSLGTLKNPSASAHGKISTKLYTHMPVFITNFTQNQSTNQPTILRYQNRTSEKANEPPAHGR